MRLTSVVLPLPVLPTMAVVWPGRAVELDVAQDRLLGARVAELDIAELDRATGRVGGRDAGGPPGASGSWMTGWVSRTSRIRPSETAARGMNTNMNTAMITANRICMRYCRKAVRLPIGIAPLSTRIAPNHMTATVERLRIRVITGMVTANSRLTRRDVLNRSRLASSKRSLLVLGPDEGADDPDAASVSRMTWLIRSSFTCIARKSGIARLMTRPMKTRHERQDDDEQRATGDRPGGRPG